jgi:hypothetical protein
VLRTSNVRIEKLIRTRNTLEAMTRYTRARHGVTNSVVALQLTKTRRLIRELEDEVADD